MSKHIFLSRTESAHGAEKFVIIASNSICKVLQTLKTSNSRSWKHNNYIYAVGNTNGPLHLSSRTKKTSLNADKGYLHLFHGLVGQTIAQKPCLDRSAFIRPVDIGGIKIRPRVNLIIIPLSSSHVPVPNEPLAYFVVFE